MITQELEWRPRNEICENNIVRSPWMQTIVQSGQGAAKDVGCGTFPVEFIGWH